MPPACSASSLTPGVPTANAFLITLRITLRAFMSRIALLQLVRELVTDYMTLHGVTMFKAGARVAGTLERGMSESQAIGRLLAAGEPVPPTANHCQQPPWHAHPPASQAVTRPS
jgi:hypothetical protein